MSPYLTVRSLRKVFAMRRGFRRHEIVAVDDVSFAVAQGTCFGIVGESGAGKSTVARIIAGLERETDGSVTLGGEMLSGLRINRDRELRRAVQIVFQNPYNSFDPRWTIGQSVTEPMIVHGLYRSRAERRDRALELLEATGLGERVYGALPAKLSGGQLQRAAIARALSSEPKVLVCDEAVASLDASIRGQVLNVLSDLRRETGITYVFISHDLEVVEQFADVVGVMLRGKLVESGPVASVFHSPKDSYTRHLLDARPSFPPATDSSGLEIDRYTSNTTVGTKHDKTPPGALLPAQPGRDCPVDDAT